MGHESKSKDSQKLQRLQKIISNAGYCSRRKAEELIEQGRVQVNGKTITIGDKADPQKDKITVEGKPLAMKSKIYIALHKPKNCVTTLHDPRGRPTVLRFIQEEERLIPVGRLDYNTEGLLLMTNDGDFANKVMHPRYEVDKTYIVELDKRFASADAEALRKGILIEEQKTHPAKIRFTKGSKDRIEVTIHEGRNRIVRKMMKKLGYQVKRLVRIQIGKVGLGNIDQGSYRRLTADEVEHFQTSQAKVRPAKVRLAKNPRPKKSGSSLKPASKTVSGKGHFSKKPRRDDKRRKDDKTRRTDKRTAPSNRSANKRSGTKSTQSKRTSSDRAGDKNKNQKRKKASPLFADYMSNRRN